MVLALRRAAEWWLGDPGRRLFVWLVWAALTGAAAGFVWEYAPNLPVHDEWLFVPALFDTPSAQFHWLFERHGEHRYPLARAVYLALFHLSGHDFRAGMWAVLALHAGAAALFLRAADRARGRAAYSDCWFPVLLLHRGHAENLLMGYQVAFLLTVFALAAFAWLAANADRLPAGRVGFLGCSLLVPLVLGGGVGVLFAPFIGGWLLWRMAVARRWWPMAAILLLLAVAAVGVWDSARAGSTAHTPEPGWGKVWTALQTVGGAAGPALTDPRSEFGAVLCAVGSCIGFAVLRWACREPDARARLLGCLALAAGVAAFVVVIAMTRGNIITPRYSVLVAVGPCALAVALAGRFPRSLFWTVIGAAFVTVGGTVVVRSNWIDAGGYARNHRAAHESISADMRLGMPADLIARRHPCWLVAGAEEAAAWDAMWRNNAGAIRGAASPRRFEVVPVGHAVAEPAEDTYRLRYRLYGGPPRAVPAVQVRYATPSVSPWRWVKFEWDEVAPDGTVTRRHREHQPWTRPNEGELLCWIDSRVRAVWLEVASAGPPMMLADAAVLVEVEPR